MSPWYKGFTGEIIRSNQGIETKGTFTVDLINNFLRITELPVGRWTRKYKNYLEELMEKQNLIEDIWEYHKTNSVDFEIIMDNDKLRKAYNNGILK